MCKNSLGMTTYTTDYIKTTRDITGMKTCIKDHQPKSKLYILYIVILCAIWIKPS